MKNRGIIRYLFYAFLFLSVGLFHTACEDDPLDIYRVGDEDPSDWNGNIYDYLKGEGCYNYYVRIIDMAEEDGIKYSEVLSRTGSKTLFVVKDEAFEAFFAGNEYGIRRFEDLSVTQCRSILFGNMLNHAYVLDMLANISGADRATAGTMRRTTDLPNLDSIPFERGDALPYNRFWDRFRETGVHLMTDGGKRDAYTMVHFLERHMKLSEVSITDEDFYVMTHVNRQAGDAYLFDVKIVERNIRCKNGYVNVLERVLLPRDNMAEYIRKNPNTSVFSRFLERYAIPLVSPLNDTYRRMYPEATDTLFSKVFMNKTNFLEGGSMTVDGEIITLSSLLNFDPGNNGYAPSNKLEQDMGAIFVPTDAALNEYFTSGSGRFLQERYGSWDSVPDLVLDKLINNHMRLSFINSIPSRFGALEDKMGTKMGVQPGDIEYAYICSNGIVYVTNKVYSPTEYVSIMAPVRTNENTSIFAWTIDRLQFDLYLLSMENQFTFLVPTDDAFDNYIDPSSLARGTAERWK
ncbi:MAG: hypothetical protein LBM08_13240, partial [Dysgonamonadaceae bacterium]|nr:hypothetical protein [Dysgonamonadaceae bacterium]